MMHYGKRLHRRWPQLLMACLAALPLSFSSISWAGLVEKVPTLWRIQPASDAGKEFDVDKDGVVSLTTLVPDSAVELAADALRAPDGAIIALKGEQLYSRSARGTTAYCATSSRKMLAGGAIGEPGTAATDPCFIDSDGDGRFDESFRIDTWNATLFGLAFVSKKHVAIQPIAYRTINVGDIKDKYYVGIKYIGTNSVTHREQFSAAFGGEKLDTLVCCNVMPEEGNYPRTVQIMGAKYTILNNDRGEIRIRVDSALPAGPFAIRGNI